MTGPYEFKYRWQSKDGNVMWFSDTPITRWSRFRWWIVRHNPWRTIKPTGDDDA